VRRLSTRAGRLGIAVVALALLAAAQLPASARTERARPAGSDPFKPGSAYRGDFPDPTVWRAGRRYYAASTTVAALNLPLMTSTDLRTWTTRAASDPANPFSADALPTPPPWAQTQQTPKRRTFMSTWAPSVARVAGAYVAAYSVPRAGDGRRCLSLARSASPTGPFVDSSKTPLGCGTGAIDPQIFLDHGKVLLLFQMAGRPGRILIRRMNSSATAFAPGSGTYELLRPAAAWEGGVVENPAMFRYRKRLYLLYSGNNWKTSGYATGYAVCKSIVGPCTRKGRLLSSGRYVAGPGGAMPFTDTAGRLRLAFHGWTPGNVGYPTSNACTGTAQGCAQRRLHFAYLTAGRRGRLLQRSWF
jgi:beta-xylosidase